MRYGIIYYILFILFAVQISIVDAAVITGITINRMDVFDSVLEEHDWFVYRWGNTIHIKTSEWVIEDEFLYDVGDLLDNLRIIETERNLRALQFIGDVQTELVYNSDSSEVKVEVTTSDQWSTVAGLTSEGSGGDYTLGFVVSESNLFGWGKDLQTEYYTGNNRRGHYIVYNDYNFFRTRLRAFLDWENNGFIRFTNTGLYKPLYSLDDRFAFWLSSYNSVGNNRYFDAGNELFRYHSRIQDVSASYTHSFGKYFKRNLTIAFNWRDENYSWNPAYNRYGNLIPPEQTECRLDFKPHFGVYKYSTTTYLNNFGNTEDLTFGWWLNLSAGRALDILGGNVVRSYGGISLSTAFERRHKLYVYASIGARARYNDDYENIIYSNKLSVFLRYPYRMVTACRVVTRFYDHPDRFIVNYIGGKYGLRGFDNFELTGQNYVIANFEQRYYSPIEVLTVALGAAAFVDIGKTWYERAGYSSTDWRSNAGVGLRFGLTKSSGYKVVRIDLARSLTEDSYYVSFGTQMYFRFAN